MGSVEGSSAGPALRRGLCGRVCGVGAGGATSLAGFAASGSGGAGSSMTQVPETGTGGVEVCGAGGVTYTRRGRLCRLGHPPIRRAAQHEVQTASFMLLWIIPLRIHRLEASLLDLVGLSALDESPTLSRKVLGAFACRAEQSLKGWDAGADEPNTQVLD